MAALKTGMDRKTARKYRRGKLPSEEAREHDWSARPDAFAEVWATRLMRGAWVFRVDGHAVGPGHFCSWPSCRSWSLRIGRAMEVPTSATEKAKDVLSPRAQQRRGFCVGPLPEGHGVEDSVFAEALLDNTTTPIPEQVQFRLDFPRWRSSRNARDQRLIDDLMLGERSSCMARKYGLSRPRVSELRRQMFEDWNRFCNATPADIRSTRGLAAVCS